MKKLLNIGTIVWCLIIGFIISPLYGVLDIKFWIIGVLNCILVIIAGKIMDKIIKQIKEKQ